ncbi:MAG: HEAT repeat domain-containing protein [Nitrospira sp.]|nr:HEAT repeat domain-containing protein [Nitrospira sp.]MCC7471164.1 HEAT repeat domain-containing protein [Candidatus Nomurabacteria bacterium]
MIRSGLTTAAGFLVFLFGLASSASAYRDYFSEAQKAELANIRSVLVEALALTDKGAGNADGIRDVVLRRMGELGYVASSDQGAPHDVVVRVKCEQRKTWEGTASAGGDNDLLDAPSRLWKGPACQVTYALGNLKVKWQKEVRTEFEDAVQAAHAAGASDPGAYAMSALREALETYEFPLLLTAEWGQPDRLLKLLDSPQTGQLRKLKVISLLGEMVADEALPHLTEALKDKELAKQAAVALGNMGKEGIPLLIEILRYSKQPDLQAAAAKGLGDLGNIHSDSRVVPPLLEMLDAPGIDITVQTEIAWALGRVPDRRSVEPLFALDRKLQKIRNDPPDPQIKKLKEAVFWSIKQVYTEDQYS